MNVNELNAVWIPLNEQLINFTHKRVPDRETAQDIVQSVYLKVNGGIGKLKDSDKIVPWIFQITRNSINDYFRHKKELDSGRMELEVQEEPTQDETMELARCIVTMINSLPEKYWEALRLSELEGLSQKELAQRLDISYSGAKSRVQRGRDKLKDVLQQRCTIKTDKYGNVINYFKKDCGGDCD